MSDRQKELLDAFEDLVCSVPLTDEDARKALREDGIDPDAALERTMAAIDKVEKTERLAAYEKAEKDRLAAETRLPEARLLPRAEMLARIQELQARLPEGTHARAHFRNLTDVPDEDLASLIAELEILIAQEEDLG